MLNIQEASQITGKSEKTIRRLIKHLLKIDKNAAKKIQQTPYPGGFTYRIDKEYILTQTQFPAQKVTQEGTPGDSQRLLQDGQEVTQLLKAKDETIAILKTEIDRLHGEIGELLERDKERNILFHKFQDALLLEAPKQRVDTGMLTIQDSTKQDVQEDRQTDQPKQRDSDKNRKQKAAAGNQQAKSEQKKYTKPQSNLQSRINSRRKKVYFHGLSENKRAI
jgi:hypothetical protein